MKRTLAILFAGLGLLAAPAAWGQQAEIPLIQTVGTPPFYGVAQAVITTEVPDGVIHYTLDGTIPDPFSPIYSGPITLQTGSTVILAIVVAPGLDPSPVAVLEVTVLPNRLTMPSIQPGYKKFYGELTVSILSQDAGATIYYTLDGSTPDAGSQLYGGPFVITEDTEVRAIAIQSGFTDSEVAVKLYRELNIPLLSNHTTLSNLSAPPYRKLYYRVAVPADTDRLTISISGGSGDCDLLVLYGRPPTPTDYDYYPQLDGNNESVLVENPAGGEWFILLWAGPEGFQGVDLSINYSSGAPPLQEPVILPFERFKAGALLVSMTQAQGAVIRYTLDGTEPTQFSPRYKLPFRITPRQGSRIIVRAKAFQNGLESETTTRIYRLGKRIKVGKSRLVSGNAGQPFFYGLVVPDGVTRLFIGITGGTGDCDLWVRYDRFPNENRYDYSSINPDNEEEVVLSNPQPGEVVFVLLKGFTDFDNTELYVDAE